MLSYLPVGWRIPECHAAGQSLRECCPVQEVQLDRSDAFSARRSEGEERSPSDGDNVMMIMMAVSSLA